MCSQWDESSLACCELPVRKGSRTGTATHQGEPPCPSLCHRQTAPPDVVRRRAGRLRPPWSPASCWAARTARRSPTRTPCPPRPTSRPPRTGRQTPARDVAAVQADLIRANLALDETGTTAAQAAEAFNGARWRAAEARAEARDAQAAADAARDDVEAQRDLYASTVVKSYEENSQVQGLSAIVEADGIETLIDRSITMGNAVAGARRPVRRLHRVRDHRRRHRRGARPTPWSGPPPQPRRPTPRVPPPQRPRPMPERRPRRSPPPRPR